MTTTTFIKSMAEAPGVRVTVEQRCPACDSRMEVGMWAVQIDGHLVCTADCHNLMYSRSAEHHRFIERTCMAELNNRIVGAITLEERDDSMALRRRYAEGEISLDKLRRTLNV